MKTIVYLGLGSNQGRRRNNIRETLALLQDSGHVTLLALSSFYETTPLGPRQPNFINAAAKVETDLAPHALLEELKGIEQEMGRNLKARRWGPRPIDIDILFYGSRRIATPTLTVPHPGIAERLFVLVPLAELDARLVHPVLKATMEQLKDRLSASFPREGRILRRYGTRNA